MIFSYNLLPESGGDLSVVDGKGRSHRNKKALALSASLSAVALGVFLEGCGGPDTPAAGTPAPAAARNVTVRGGEGDDSLEGGEGNDTLYGEAGDDTLDGGEGDDTLDGGEGVDHFVGGEGKDIVTYKDAPVAPVNEDDDAVTVKVSLLPDGSGSGEGSDAEGDTFEGIEDLEGSLGHDELTGNDGPNDLYGLAGNDKLYGGEGDDNLYGGEGADTLFGGEGDDRLDGGAGDDRLDGGAGADHFVGGAGKDIVSYENAPLALVVAGEETPFTVDVSLVFGGQGSDAGGDTFEGIEDLEGSLGRDFLKGDDGPNDLYGLAGDDKLLGNQGDDNLYGGEGNDRLQGGDGVDTLYGGANNDILEGGVGVDTLKGDAGDDTLRGGDGADILEGGAGADTYIFSIGEGSEGGIIAEDTVREVVEAGVVNTLRFTDGGYPFITTTENGESQRIVDPNGFTFEREDRDLTVVAKNNQDTSYPEVNRVKLEGYYTADTGTATDYTVRVQIGEALMYTISTTDSAVSLVLIPPAQ